MQPKYVMYYNQEAVNTSYYMAANSKCKAINEESEYIKISSVPNLK